MKIFQYRQHVQPVAVTTIEGHAVAPGVEIRELSRGQNMVMLEVIAPADLVFPAHAHDHESMMCVISGRVAATVGEQTEELGPGDTCLFPRDTLHYTHALEPSRWLEIKSPPRIVWQG